MSAGTWRPFGLAGEELEQAPRRDGVQMVAWRAGDGSQDRAGKWLRNAMLALAVLAAAAAVVSYQAQYELIASLKHARVIAAVQAGIPDVGAAVFACLGIAMALHGKRAVRARALNLVCVGHLDRHERAGRARRLAPAGRLGHGTRFVRARQRHADRRHPVVDRWPGRRRSARPWPATRAARPWPRWAALRCGCCGCPWLPGARSAVSAAGWSRNARSHPGGVR